MTRVQSEAASERHLPQLDAVRCFAVLMVVWSHTAGQGSSSIGRVSIGVFAVWLFFVLSGYLITGILLRAATAHAHAGRRRLLYVFYARRFLRIFPAYYLLLAVGAAFAISRSFRADWIWHVTYTTNWLIAIRGAWTGATGPLWSLGVEEQFYLVWPLLILTIPRARLPKVFASLIAVGIASRAFILVMGIHGGSEPTFVTPTPANLDPLAIGALLAWAHAGHVAEATTDLCIMGYALLWSMHVVERGWSILPIVETLGGALVSVYVVHRTARGVSPTTLVGRVVSARPVQYVGKISYAIYLWHVAIRTVLLKLAPAFELTAASTFAARLSQFLVVGVLSILVASASWYLYERPINSLKDRFRYPARAASEPSDAPSIAPAALPLAV
jgi:peptidoglycan/LPS O-acetylase OafA/YrhL